MKILSLIPLMQSPGKSKSMLDLGEILPLRFIVKQWEKYTQRLCGFPRFESKPDDLRRLGIDNDLDSLGYKMLYCKRFLRTSRAYMTI